MLEICVVMVLWRSGDRRGYVGVLRGVVCVCSVQCDVVVRSVVLGVCVQI